MDIQSFRRPLRTVSAEVPRISPADQPDVRRTKSSGIPVAPVGWSRPPQAQSKDGSRKPRSNACSLQTMLAFILGAAVMFTIMRHMPSLLGSSVGIWATVPAGDLHEQLSVPHSASNKSQDRDTLGSKEVAGGKRPSSAPPASRRELRISDGPSKPLPVAIQQEQPQTEREADKPAEGSASSAEQTEVSTEENKRLPSQDTNAQDEEQSTIAGKDEPSEALVELAESQPADAAKQTAKQDELLESFMAGASLDVKERNGMVVLEEGEQETAGEVAHSSGIDTTDLAQALQQSANWEVREVADAT